MNGFKRLSREKGPGKKDDVDFMGIKREKILDFSPIRGKTAEEMLRVSLMKYPAASSGVSSSPLTLSFRA